jgi:hypothetical protein
VRLILTNPRLLDACYAVSGEIITIPALQLPLGS